MTSEASSISSPCSAMACLEEYIDRTSDLEKKKVLRDQWSEACEQGSIHCACGLQRALPLAYRCLYCGQYYCGQCAEIHFGQTVRQWIESKRVEKRKELMARKQNTRVEGRD